MSRETFGLCCYTLGIIAERFLASESVGLSNAFLIGVVAAIAIFALGRLLRDER